MVSVLLKIWSTTLSGPSCERVQFGFLVKLTNWPVCHSCAWYGPDPTTGGSFWKSQIVSMVRSPQMCLGRIGT